MPTRIEWTDISINPVTGCSPTSPGCKNCYARRMAYRLRGRCGYPQDDPFAVTLHYDKLDKISDLVNARKPRKVFICSMGDLFHEDVPDSFIEQVMIAAAGTRRRGHVFQFLTKRPERMRDLILKWFDLGLTFHEGCTGRLPSFFWFGVTAENQQTANERIPILLSIPAAVRFVSVEPLLGPIDISVALEGTDYERMPPRRPVNWVIVGSESGPGARPMKEEWARKVVSQCETANVPVFYKQIIINGKKIKTPMLDGKRYTEFPQTTGRQSGS